MPTATRVSPPTGKALETRSRILERSVELASTDGLEALTIGRLAGDLEMSKSGLFAHFGSKEELQVATVEAAAQRFIASVIEPAGEAEPGAPRLRALCDRYLEHLQEEVFPGGCFFGQAGHEFDSKPGPVRDALRLAMGGWMGVLEHQAELAGAERPAEFAFELQSLVQGANFNHQLLDDQRVFGYARDAVRQRLKDLG